MRRISVFFLCILSSGLLRCGRKTVRDYPITPVPFTQVAVDDGFWSPRLETNRKITIPYAFGMCEKTGRIDNFAVAGGLKEGTFVGYYFNDSDVYKVIEGAAYALHLFPDPALETYVDAVIAKIASAQESDGYLYTSRTILNPDNMPPGGKERWSSIQWGHELYCAGHLYEAAVAYHSATGKRTLLDVALKNADLVDRVFGPGRLRFPSGHQEIEIGLAKLFRETGEKRYLALAQFFLDQRGDSTGHTLYGEYAQDHRPVIFQTKAVGHAVRAAYMYTGMADIAALTGNPGYVRAIQRIWEDVTGNKLYITGGIGASGGNEGFSGEYELPNASAYCETCASIANALWNHRLFLMTGDSRYMDIVERVLYNGFLSGISMKGDRFFYPNRLLSFKGAERSPWFDCACCPSNIVRFLPSIPGYMYGQRGREVFVNLYIGGAATLDIAGQSVRLVQEHRYPWEGEVLLRVEPSAPLRMTFCLRIPGWVQGRPVPSALYRYLNADPASFTLAINGETIPLRLKNGYAVVDRIWQKGDTILLTLPMENRRTVASDSVEADQGKVALERGPIVFAAEGIDQSDAAVYRMMLPDGAALQSAFEPELLGGVRTLTAEARILREGSAAEGDPVTLKMIPYYAWAHRGLTPMTVWIAREAEAVLPLHPDEAQMKRY